MKKLCTLFCLALVCTLAAAVEHPHLLFSRSDLPALRKRIATEAVPKAAMALMRQRCDTVLKSGKLPAWTYEKFFDPLTEILLVWHLTGEKKYADGFLRLYRNAVAKKNNLGGYNKPMIFDLGYYLLSAKERFELRKYFQRKGKIGGVDDRMLYSNWHYCVTAPRFLRALALYGEPEYDERYVKNYSCSVECFFDAFYNKDGLPEEGWTYHHYGLQVRGALAVEAMLRKGLVRIKGTNFAKAPKAILESVLPDKHLMIPPFSDAQRAYMTPESIRYLAHWMPDDPYVPFLLRDVVNRNNAVDPATSILFYPKVKPAPAGKPYPASVRNVLYSPEYQMMLYKSSFAPTATAFMTSARNSCGHAHNDAGSFMLEHGGQQWIIDPGYAKYDAGAHSSVLIDEESELHPELARGVIKSTLISPSALFFDIDMTPHWNFRQKKFILPSQSPVISARRAFAVSLKDKKLNIPFYLMVFDRIQKDQGIHKYTQCFPFLNTMKVTASGSTITCSRRFRRNDKLILHCLAPADVKSSARTYNDFSKYPKEFKRGDFTMTGRICQFSTMVYPYEKGLDPRIVPLDNHNYQCKIVWPTATDYWVWKNPDDIDDSHTPSFAMFRCKKGDPTRMENIISYFVCDAENITIRMGSGKFLTRWESAMNRHHMYLQSGARINAAFQNGVLHVELFTPVNVPRPASRHTEVEIWAPNTKEVWCNGKKCNFRQNGNYVTFFGWSTLPGNVEYDMQKQHQKIYEKYLNNYWKLFGQKGVK